MKQGAGSGGYGSGGNGGLQQGEFDASGARRPHTASATGRSSGGGVYVGQHVQVDPRTSKPVQSGEGEEEGDDAHVVAGARAMMRYRRTRASGSEGQSGPGGGSGGGAPSQPKGWTGGEGGPYGTQPRAIYQNPNKTSAQQQQLMQQQQMTRSKGGSSGQGISNLNSGGGGQHTWMSSGQGGESRPKSAGVMSSLTGQQQRASGAVGQGAPGQGGQSNSLSYGSLRSRFLSGSNTGQGVHGKANDGSQQSKSASASKLFSISR